MKGAAAVDSFEKSNLKFFFRITRPIAILFSLARDYEYQVEQLSGYCTVDYSYRSMDMEIFARTMRAIALGLQRARSTLCNRGPDPCPCFLIRKV
jgi:hypothetical protein